jgi:hypothetical protein
MPNVALNATNTPWASQQEDILRRRKMAELLQAQAYQPIANNQVNGITTANSPLEYLGKMLQGYSAQKQQEALTGESKKNAENYQKSLSAGMGSAAIQPQSSVTPVDDNGNPNPMVAGTPAQKPDSMAMASILMGHPATQQLGQQEMLTEMKNKSRSQMLAQILGGSAAGGTQGGTAGIGKTVDPQIMSLMISGDPELASVGKALLESSKGIAQRPGAPIVNGRTGEIIAQAPPSMPQGMQNITGPNGNQASVVPGFQQSSAQLGIQPIEKVQNPDQTFSYIPKSDLISAGKPTGPMGSMTPSQTIQGTAETRGGARSRILGDELANYDQRMRAGETLSQEDQSGYSALKKEMGIQFGGGLGNSPKFGQNQQQMIEQAGQMKEAEKSGAGLGDIKANIYTEGVNATKSLPQLQSMTEMVKTFTPGKLTPLASTLGQWAVGTGLMTEPEANKTFGNIGSMQALTSASTRMAAIALRQSDGNPAVKQLELMLQSMPNADQTPEGFALTMQFMQAADKMKITKMQAAHDYFQKPNATTSGFETEWSRKVPDLQQSLYGTITPTTTTPTAGIMENKSKSGRPIVSKDGGRTWEYKDLGVK